MGSHLILDLPLPPPQLSPNARVHWAVRARHVKEYREMVYLEALAQKGDWLKSKDEFIDSQSRLFHITETFRVYGTRKRDLDNLHASFKAGRDALVDAGILVGDDDSVLEHGPPRIVRVSDKKESGVTVEIEL